MSKKTVIAIAATTFVLGVVSTIKFLNWAEDDAHKEWQTWYAANPERAHHYPGAKAARQARRAAERNA